MKVAALLYVFLGLAYGAKLPQPEPEPLYTPPRSGPQPGGQGQSGQGSDRRFRVRPAGQFGLGGNNPTQGQAAGSKEILFSIVGIMTFENFAGVVRSSELRLIQNGPDIVFGENKNFGVARGTANLDSRGTGPQTVSFNGGSLNIRVLNIADPRLREELQESLRLAGITIDQFIARTGRFPASQEIFDVTTGSFININGVRRNVRAGVFVVRSSQDVEPNTAGQGAGQGIGSRIVPSQGAGQPQGFGSPQQFASQGAGQQQFASQGAGQQQFASQGAGQQQFVSQGAGQQQFVSQGAGQQQFVPQGAGQQFVPQGAGQQQFVPQGAGSPQIVPQQLLSRRFGSPQGFGPQQGFAPSRGQGQFGGAVAPATAETITVTETAAHETSTVFETVTLTKTQTQDEYVTISSPVYNSIAATVTNIVKQTVTVPEEQVIRSPVAGNIVVNTIPVPIQTALTVSVRNTNMFVSTLTAGVTNTHAHYVTNYSIRTATVNNPTTSTVVQTITQTQVSTVYSTSLVGSTVYSTTTRTVNIGGGTTQTTGGYY